MKNQKYLLIILAFLSFTEFVYAAPVGVTSGADVVRTGSRSGARSRPRPDKTMALGVGFILDYVTERKMDIDNGKFEMRVYGIRTGLSLNDRFNFYVDLGEARDIEYEYTIMGENYRTKFNEDLAWGVGANALIDRADSGLGLEAHANYRRATMDLQESSIDDIRYTRGEMSSVSDGYFEEYQLALELSWRSDYLYNIPYGFIPYIGVKYSAAEIDADFFVQEVQRNASTNGGQNIGLFFGFTIIPKTEAFPATKQLGLNIEARFIDEKAVNVGMNYKF